MGGKSLGSGVDALISALAAVQHGVVSREQLLSRGISSREIERRIDSRQLHPVHGGVYLVGHEAALPKAHEMAAVLACGEGTRASHRSATFLWGFLPHQPKPVEVTVPRRWKPERRGIRVYTSAPLSPEETTELDGIPVTGAARTLLDLAGVVSEGALERSVATAYATTELSRSDLVAQLDRTPTRRGAAALRRLLAGKGEPAFTRSEAEVRLLRLVRRADLPTPEVNVRVGAFEVDFLWRHERLIVEVDGFAFHSDHLAFERDRRRDAELQALGFRVIRVTWRQLVDTPAEVVNRIRRALQLGIPGSSTA